jgi:hypothetical protein
VQASSREYAVKLVLALFALFSVATPAFADACDAHAAALVRETGATIVRRSDDKIFFKLRDVSVLAVACTSKPSVDIGVEVGSPPDVFFVLAGRVAHAITGLSVSSLKEGALRCYHRALAADDTIALDYAGAHFECAAAIARAAGHVSITISRK